MAGRHPASLGYRWIYRQSGGWAGTPRSVKEWSGRTRCRASRSRMPDPVARRSATCAAGCALVVTARRTHRDCGRRFPRPMTPPSSVLAESVFPPGGPCRWTGYPIVSAVRWPAGEPFLSPGRIHPPGPSAGHDRTSCMPRARLAPDAPRTACRCPGRRGRDSCCSACASACCSPNTCRAELASLTRMTWMAIAGGPLAEQARSTGIYGARAAMNRRR